MMPLMKMFSRPEIRVEAGAELDQRRDAPSTVIVPLFGRVIRPRT